MRLDRFITLNLVQPFRHAFCGVSSLVTRHSSLVTSLPILMYHSISDDPEPGVRPYYRVCTGPERFREQMQWLKDHGYRGVTLNAGLTWLNSQHEVRNAKHETRIAPVEKSADGNRQSQPSDFRFRTSNAEPRPVAITFDDGFRDFYTLAFPILQQHGFLATMYLPTGSIGDQPRWFKSRECLTWNEIQELHRAGIEFGSHTVHHPKLIDLAWPDIQFELRDSRADIENRLGVPVKAFAYPYAFPETRRDFVGRFKDLVMAGGYETCVTTQIGRVEVGDDPFRLKRLPVNQDDDPALLAAKLEGAYDWLALLQTIAKRLKSSISLSARRNFTPAQSPESGSEPSFQPLGLATLSHRPSGWEGDQR